MILKKLSKSGIFIQSGIILLVMLSKIYFPISGMAFDFVLFDHLSLFHLLNSAVQPLGLFWLGALGIALLVMCGFLFNQMVIKSDLLPKQSILIVLIYCLLLLAGGHLSFALVSFFITLVLLGSLHSILGLVSGQRAYVKVMNATIGISVVSLIVPQAVFFMLFVWLGFFTLRIGTWREWVISLIGFLTPYFYYLVFLFLTDGLIEVLDGYRFFFEGFSLNYSDFGITELAVFSVLLLLVLFSIPSFLSDAGERIISIRKKMWLHFHFFWTGLLALIFSAHGGVILMPVLFLPMALMIAHTVVFKRKSWAIDVLMIVLIVLIFGLRVGF